MLFSSGPSMALKEFSVSSTPDTNGVYVTISGRPEGLIGSILSLLKLSSDASLIVSAHQVSLVMASISGQTHSMVPMNRVSSTHCGYKRNTAYLIIAAFFLLSAIGSIAGTHGAVVFVIGAIVSAVFALAYWMSNRLVIVVETGGGMTIGMRIQPSVIRSVNFDFAQAQRVVDIINTLVLTGTP
ncbi:MAG: hypothetical protein NTW19_04610 [Planctomycetota bacterium]|nr:hypothetical protein [Planctomycetota bacterium]